MCGEEIQASCLSEDCFHARGDIYSRTFKSYCYSRDCTESACQRARKSRYTRKIEAKINKFSDKTFITLTFKGNYPGTQETFDRINQCWRAFTQALRRKGLIKGYIKVIELGLRPNQRYFFHIHAVIDGKGLIHKELSETWLRITKDSYIVWTVPINSDFWDYLVKYLVKGYYGLLSAKRKMISYWGKYPEDAKPGKPKCPHCGSALFFPKLSGVEERILDLYQQTTIDDYRITEEEAIP